MRKRKERSRWRQILRNCILTVIAVVLLWACAGCPPLTKEMMIKTVARQNLLTAGEIIKETPDLIYIDCGDVVLLTQYRWYLLYYDIWGTYLMVYDESGQLVNVLEHMVKQETVQQNPISE